LSTSYDFSRNTFFVKKNMFKNARERGERKEVVERAEVVDLAGILYACQTDERAIPKGGRLKQERLKETERRR